MRHPIYGSLVANVWHVSGIVKQAERYHRLTN